MRSLLAAAPSPGGDIRRGGPVVGCFPTASTCGSAHEPVMRTRACSPAPAARAGRAGRQKLPSLHHRVDDRGASDAAPRLISGTTTRRSCVSRAAVGAALEQHHGLGAASSGLLWSGRARMLTSPVTKSNAKPWNTSRKSSVRRRASDCRLSTPSSPRRWTGLRLHELASARWPVDLAGHARKVHLRRRADPVQTPLQLAPPRDRVRVVEAAQRRAAVGDAQVEGVFGPCRHAGARPQCWSRPSVRWR